MGLLPRLFKSAECNSNGIYGTAPYEESTAGMANETSCSCKRSSDKAPRAAILLPAMARIVTLQGFSTDSGGHS